MRDTLSQLIRDGGNYPRHERLTVDDLEELAEAASLQPDDTGKVQITVRQLSLLVNASMSAQRAFTPGSARALGFDVEPDPMTREPARQQGQEIKR